MRASHNALVDLFERIERFFKRLGVYTQVSLAAEMVEVFVNIVVEVLSILSIATKEVKRRRASEFLRDILQFYYPLIRSGIYFRKLLGRTDIEDAFKRLDNLIREEGPMAIAQTYKATMENKDGKQTAHPVSHFTLNRCPPRSGESQCGYGRKHGRNKVFVVCYFHYLYRRH